MPSTALTGALMRTLVEGIRRGAHDRMAAEAVGIGRRTFYRWIERGDPGYSELAAAVRRARAEARMGTEQWVREHQPLSWQRLGPGRERRGEPGWTKPVKGKRGSI